MTANRTRLLRPCALHQTRRIFLVALLVALCTSPVVLAQQNITYGRVVTTSEAPFVTAMSNQDFGGIERYDINNNVVSQFGSIYNGSDARCANISPDGNRVAFIRRDSKICIINMDGTGSVNVFADIDQNDGWLDWPVPDWIYVSPGFARLGLHRVNVHTGVWEDLGDLRVEKTWTISIAKDLTRACISDNNSGWKSHIVTLVDNKVSTVQEVGACGGSISPDGKLFTLNIGDHATCQVREFDKYGSVYRSWTTSSCPDAGPNWNRHRWSANSNDWVVFTQGAPYQMESYHNVVLYYVPDGGSTCVQVTDNSAGHYNEGDDLWIQTSTVPVIGFSPSNLSFEVEIGSAAPQPKTTLVSNFGADVLPSLSASSSQGWCAVSISGSENSYTVTNEIIPDGLPGGIHTATVTVDGNGVEPAAYTVQLTVVSPPVLTEIAVDNTFVSPGGSTQCEAFGYDQYGVLMTPQPSFSWSVVSGGGTISATGMYTAPDSETSAVVQAAAAGTSGQGTVAVSTLPPIHLKIDCGNSPFSGWESDKTYLTTGNDWLPDFAFSESPDLSGVVFAAPAEVYRTAPLSRDHSGYHADVPNAPYRVRMHFMLGSSHTGLFKMDWFIEGEQVLDDFDVKSQGGYDRAVVQEFDVTVSDGNGLDIEGRNDGGVSVFLPGVEIIAGHAGAPPITVTSPNGGETFGIGETMTIAWSGNPEDVGAVVVDLSVDNGDSWTIISGTTSIPGFTEGMTTGSFAFSIPESIRDINLVSTSCLVRVCDYMTPQFSDHSDGVFAIVASGSATHPSAAMHALGRIRVSSGRDGLRVDAPLPEYAVAIFDLRGTLIVRMAGHPSGTLTIAPEQLPRVACVVQVRCGSKIVRKVVTPSWVLE